MEAKFGFGRTKNNDSQLKGERPDNEHDARTSGQGQESMINISDLHVYYGRLHVLKGINLKIQERTTTVIMGPSGCGKTTLIRTLNRMNDDLPNFRVSGVITIQGFDIYSEKVDPTLLKLKVGMVFQKPNLSQYPYLTTLPSAPRYTAWQRAGTNWSQSFKKVWKELVSGTKSKTGWRKTL